MYGITDKAQFLVAKNVDVFTGQELMVQTAWPHIVGRVRRFGPTVTQEARRQEWVERIGESVPVAQSMTHRIYVELVGTLQDVRRSRIERVLGRNADEYVRDILTQMMEYVMVHLRPGQEYALRWEKAIVPDKYYEEMKKARKQEQRRLLAESAADIQDDPSDEQ